MKLGGKPVENQIFHKATAAMFLLWLRGEGFCIGTAVTRAAGALSDVLIAKEDEVSKLRRRIFRHITQKSAERCSSAGPNQR